VDAIERYPGVLSLGGALELPFLGGKGEPAVVNVPIRFTMSSPNDPSWMIQKETLRSLRSQPAPRRHPRHRRSDQAAAGAETHSVCRDVRLLVQFAGHILGVQNCLRCCRILLVHQDVE
jgi:hypothetical protein